MDRCPIPPATASRRKRRASSDSMKKRVRRMTSQSVKDEGHCKLRRRDQNNDANNLVDRISVLPDEILVSILSLLHLKEAQATSVLSKRWRHVWASIRTLDFDSAPTKSYIEDEIGRFVLWINSVVKQHNAPRIELFRVRSHLNQEIADSIDKWVQFAMEKGVRTLELDLSVFGCAPPMYTFPLDLIKHSCDDHIPVQVPCTCIGLKFLKVLSFNCVNVAGGILEYFLSNCPVLERLLVRGCSSLSNLKVAGSSVALKYLLIEYCRNMKSIELCEANLVSFIYNGDCRNLLLRNVPLLVEVSISMPSIKDCIEVSFTQLSCLFSQLKILKLDHLGTNETDRVLQYKNDLGFPVLASLKHLELCLYTEDDCILLHITSFLNATPNLQSLVLLLDPAFAWITEIKYKASKCSHQNLRVVQLVGYDIGYGYSAYHLEVVKYLTKSAVKLEKFVITPNEDNKTKEDRVMKDIEEEVKIEKARNHSTLQHTERVPITIASVEYDQYFEMRSEFVCLY